MSGDQALALKGLEKDYEVLLDENCRIFVQYFKEVLKNNGDEMIAPPTIVLHKSCERDDDNDDGGGDRDDESDNIKSQGFGSTTNRRYINVMINFLRFFFYFFSLFTL